jgi:hypothetical protein
MTFNAKLLSVSADAKTVKGQKKGYLTGILYLSPANESGVMNTCVNASEGCKAACLYTAGRAAIFPMINKARLARTLFLHSDRSAFLAQLVKEIHALVRKASREGLKPCVRLNGTSDLPWLAFQIAPLFPKVKFYDYTKLPTFARRELPNNYHLTFSYSETNEPMAREALSHGLNVAMVFDSKRGKPLPREWNGFKVFDADKTDLRFADRQRGAIAGLRAKGRAKKDCSGFVIRRPQLVQIGTIGTTQIQY